MYISRLILTGQYCQGRGSMLSILLTLFLVFFFTEAFGYVLHVVLHSQKIEFLSRNHMIHHLQVYGPKMSQRPDDKYLKSTHERAAVLGIGMEWILPILFILGLIIGVGVLVSAPLHLIGIFIIGSLSWGYFLFGYMHDSMHLQGFWMEKNRFLQGWYLHIRKLHDIHHLHLSDEGKMNVNYGICFFFFDKIFGTYKKSFSRFNSHGYSLAKEKYKYIFKGV